MVKRWLNSWGFKTFLNTKDTTVARSSLRGGAVDLGNDCEMVVELLLNDG